MLLKPAPTWKVPVGFSFTSTTTSMVLSSRRGRVVISTVGPYALYGEPMIRACVSSGTDYCDLTGEVQWIAAMLEKYEDQAKQSGARIVHCCGFDSIPSDMGTYFLQQQARARFKAPATRVTMRVKVAKGGVSDAVLLARP